MEVIKTYEQKRSSDEDYNRNDNECDRNLGTWRSNKRQWDKIICTVCTGCGKPLGRYENLNRLAFCLACREVLFPETVPPRKPYGRGSPY